MFQYRHIEGIEILNAKLPPELQYWHRFGNILELNYSAHTIDEYYCDYTNKLTMLLTDDSRKYRIELTCWNTDGKMSFDTVNGLFSGFAIDELAHAGIRKIFHLYSDEQDIAFDVYCEKIRAVLK